MGRNKPLRLRRVVPRQPEEVRSELTAIAEFRRDIVTTSEANLVAAIELRVKERLRARTDIMYLATEILGYDFQPDVHTELFNNFFEVKYDGPDPVPLLMQSDEKDVMVLWSRGHYKTTAVVVRIIHLILNFPDIRVLIMQGSLKTTKRLLSEVASHFLGDARNSRLSEIFPEFCGVENNDGTWHISRKTLQCTQESFTVPCRGRKQLQQATVTCASPKSTKTGQHYDAAFFDDLVNDQNYRKLELLQKVLQDFDMCGPLIDPGGYRCITGTRYAHTDLYAEINRRALVSPGQWIISIKTCWSDDGKKVRFPRRILPDGRPVGFTREELERKRSDDPGMFAGQYLNQPVSVASQLFTDAMLLDACISEKDTPALSQAVLFVDLASSGGPVSDDSVIIAGKTDSFGRLYVVDGIGGQWSPYQLAPALITMALKHRPLRLLIENNSATKYFVAYLLQVCRDRNIQLPIDYIKCDNGKDAKKIRIASIEGLLRTKKLRFLLNLDCWEKMRQQFVEWPEAPYRHDDYPDTVALMCKEMGAAIMQFPTARPQHPLLDAMERQGINITRTIVEGIPTETEGCGTDFAC